MVKISSKNAKAKAPTLKLAQVAVAFMIGCYFWALAHKSTDSSILLSESSLSAESSSKSSKEERNAQEISTPDKTSGTDTTTIGYAVSVTGCGSDPLAEGAAVLKHSIHLASIHGAGRYDYKMYAIYHPVAKECVMPLEELGYVLLERNTPVEVADIEGEFLKSRIEKNGCCGEKELIKLEAYTLTDHPVVVHLDLDVLVLKPLDALFDIMMDGPTASNQQAVKVQWPKNPFPTEQVNAFFTRDYNMHTPGRKHAPVQGGFLVVRPDMEVYKEYVAIVKKGDFREGGGWGGETGVFYGSMTIQGLVPYYYNVLHPDTFVELDPCEFNQMCNNPRDGPTKNDILSGKCRTGEEDCQDCRSLPLEKVVTTHFTLCQKPWWCLPHDVDRIQERLCRKLLHEWYRVRSDLEKSWGRSGMGETPEWGQTDHFFGYCSKAGKHGYIPIAKPYGGPAAAVAGS